MKIRKNALIELIAAFYINSFVLLKPILTRYSNISIYLLMIEVFLLLVIYIINSDFKLNVANTEKMFIFFVLVSGVFLLDFVFRKNSLTFNYYHYFLIYGALTSVFFINVKNFEKLLRYWTIFAIIGGCIYILDPLYSYRVSGGYMEFGSAVLPAFVASIIACFYYKIKYILPITAVFLLEIVIYGNKGATFSAIGAIIFFTIYLTKNKSGHLKRICLLLFSIIIAFFLKYQILKILIKIANYIGIRSYALIGLEESISLGGKLDSYSVRNGIWGNIILELKHNLFFGMGIGGFEKIYGNYAHNFVLDILITHGILLSIIILVIIFIFIRNTINFKNKDLFIFAMSILLLWSLPMLFSFTYWTVSSFWIFLIINMYINKYIVR